jgi:hypothetical protein
MELISHKCSRSLEFDLQCSSAGVELSVCVHGWNWVALRISVAVAAYMHGVGLADKSEAGCFLLSSLLRLTQCGTM